jgi:ribosomal protein S18 acetylase RimI-like enzyme
MKSDSGGLIRLEKGQVEPASEVLSRAFIDDPELVRLVPEPPKREKLLRSLFRMSLRHGIRRGEVYAVSPAIEGIAVWFPSGMPAMTLWTTIRCGGLSLLFRASWDFLWRMKQDENVAHELRQRLAPAPHWYLALLGVDPKFQGRGYASRLLQLMLDRLDAEGLPCYVETSTEEYVQIYQRFGFRVVHKTELPGSGSHMWAMLREKK